jgi:hypothetical protein
MEQDNVDEGQARAMFGGMGYSAVIPKIMEQDNVDEGYMVAKRLRHVMA